MDVIDIVREIAPAVSTPEETVVSARRRLMSGISAQRRPAKARRPRTGLRWAGGLVAAGAAVAVGAVVVTNLLPVDPGDPGAPPVLVPPAASAAEVLETAADTTLAGSAVEPAAGQYLLIEETMSFLNLAIEDAATGDLVPMGTRENAVAGFVSARTTRLYVPADREDEWVWDLSDPWQATERFGDRADQAVADWERLETGVDGTPEIWRLPGGRDPQNPENPDATVDGRELWEQMPREPQALLDWFRERSGETGAAADAVAVWTMSSTLSSSLAPAELRAVIFDALALGDGMTVEDTGDGTAAFEFRVEGDGWTRTTAFTLDTATALTTELSDLALPDGDSVVPDDVPDEHRTVRVSVVETAP